MERISYLIILVYVVVLTQGSRISRQIARPCRTPRSELGECVSIHECPLLLELKRRQISFPGADTFIRKSLCGGEPRKPRFCCPTWSKERHASTVRAETPNSALLPDPPHCGVTDVSNLKIVGGQYSQLGAWPWLVALGYSSLHKEDGPIWSCAGVLINHRYVLTAAHCIKPQRFRLTKVRLGDLDLNSTDDEATPVDLGIESVKIHERYTRGKLSDDIALIRLNRDVVYNRNIRPICLPKASELKSKKFDRLYPFVAGWGLTKNHGKFSSMLQEVQVPVIDNPTCAKKYKAKYNVQPKNLCAGYTNGGKDACQGDSGAPLMLPIGSSYYTIGVVSFGIGCADKQYPGVYTRVTEYIDWISNNIRK